MSSRKLRVGEAAGGVSVRVRLAGATLTAMALLVACAREEAAPAAVPLSYNEAVYCTVAAS